MELKWVAARAVPWASSTVALRAALMGSETALKTAAHSADGKASH
jgi:hypothetical protein